MDLIILSDSDEGEDRDISSKKKRDEVSEWRLLG